MQRNQHFLLLIFLSIVHAQTALAMQEKSIVEKVESYLDAHPEYVSQSKFVTGFICDDSNNIVHASVQPDLTTEFHLRNGSPHPTDSSYLASVIPTSNIRAVHEHECSDEYCAKCGNSANIPENKLGIYAYYRQTHPYPHLECSSMPRKCLSYNPISLAERKDITTANISFDAIRQIIAADNSQTFDTAFEGKTPHEATKIVALLRLARDVFARSERGKVFCGEAFGGQEDPTFASLPNVLKHTERYGANGSAMPGLSFEVYPCQEGTVAQIVYSSMDWKEIVKQPLPFKSATLAAHKKGDLRMHAFIKDSSESIPRAITPKETQEAASDVPRIKTMSRVEAVASVNVSDAPQYDASPSSGFSFFRSFANYIGRGYKQALEEQQKSQQ